MKTTPFEYHDKSSNHGNYQYVTLKQIVNEFVADIQDDDHILKNTRRSTFVAKGKEAVSKVSLGAFKEFRAMEISVPENLSFVLPHDYVDYARVSLVVSDPNTNSYRLKPLNINQRLNTADGYLQDHNFEILFDDDGGIITADSKNVYNFPYKKYSFEGGQAGQPLKDTSKLSKYGEFVINKENGLISFSSDMVNQEIVMEYYTDGLSFDTYGEGEIKVHKYAKETVKNWMKYAILETKKNINQVTKDSALRRFKTTNHKLKIKAANFSISEISRAMRSSSKNK